MNFIRYFFFFLLLLISVFSYSQTLQRKDTIKMICREWKFKEAYSNNLSDKDTKDFMGSARLLFKLNMTGAIKDEDWKEDFKWSYNSRKREIIIEMKDEKVKAKIILLSSSAIKLEIVNSDTFSSGTLIPAN